MTQNLAALHDIQHRPGFRSLFLSAKRERGSLCQALRGNMTQNLAVLHSNIGLLRAVGLTCPARFRTQASLSNAPAHPPEHSHHSRGLSALMSSPQTDNAASQDSQERPPQSTNNRTNHQPPPPATTTSPNNATKPDISDGLATAGVAKIVFPIAL